MMILKTTGKEVVGVNHFTGAKFYGILFPWQLCGLVGRRDTKGFLMQKNTCFFFNDTNECLLEDMIDYTK